MTYVISDLRGYPQKSARILPPRHPCNGQDS